ncbi:hypothetical protein [Lichenihabitans psoromatis]|uniref:hypothetical protein n=1 Tax=Lichenihabitans psoromatis TaxID=2528642 RepID=UPI0010383C11|nr:hypothetical protein [Lichenihabitans psoromatis]
MLPLSRYPSSGRLTFPFEDLYVTFAEGDTASHRPVYGHVVIDYDGRGGWWPEAITLHARDYVDRRTTYRLTHGSKVWLEIIRRLETHRGEAIAAAINDALGGDGMHMVLFGEHLPPETMRRAAPPHIDVRTRAVHGFGYVRDTAAATTRLALDAAASAAFVAGVMAAAYGFGLKDLPHSEPNTANLTALR